MISKCVCRSYYFPTHHLNSVVPLLQSGDIRCADLVRDLICVINDLESPLVTLAIGHKLKLSVSSYGYHTLHEVKENVRELL